MIKTMKKLSAQMVLLALTLVASTTVFAKAKATDFNDIIEENNKAQSTMHVQVRQNLNETEALLLALKQTHPETVVADSESVNVPTSSDLLKFEKEKKHYQPSRAEGDKRLAQELDDMQ